MTLMTEIASSIQESNTALNVIIQNYLDTAYIGAATTVAQWRLDNYVQLRFWGYPKESEYNDSQVKINSGIAELVSEGEDQFDDYVQDCLDVKTKFPKE